MEIGHFPYIVRTICKDIDDVSPSTHSIVIKVLLCEGTNNNNVNLLSKTNFGN